MIAGWAADLEDARKGADHGRISGGGKRMRGRFGMLHDRASLGEADPGWARVARTLGLCTDGEELDGEGS